MTQGEHPLRDKVSGNTDFIISHPVFYLPGLWLVAISGLWRQVSVTALPTLFCGAACPLSGWVAEDSRVLDLAAGCPAQGPTLRRCSPSAYCLNELYSISLLCISN